MTAFKVFLALAVVAFVIAGLANGGEKDLGTFLRERCNHCHSGEIREGGLDLREAGTDLNNPDVLRRWVRIHDRVASGEMPPKSEPWPDKATVQLFLEQLSGRITQVDAGMRRTALRRLNRVEYENTVCDLFGIHVSLKDMLPEDPPSYGFDTVGDALSISPEHLEFYLQAAERAVGQVLGSDRAPAKVAVRMPLGRDPHARGGIGELFVKTDDDSLINFQDGWSPAAFISGRAMADGTYRASVQAKTHQSNNPIVMAVHGGGLVSGSYTVHLVGYYDIAPGKEWTTISFEDFLEVGGCFKMTPYGLKAPTRGPDRFKGPGLMIGEVSVEGPLEEWPPVSRKALLGNINPLTATIDDAREILARLLPRAFRRRIQSLEVEPFVVLTKSALDSKRPFLEALSVGLKAILCSPEFLMREEPVAVTPENGSPTISDEALASRMSYFLWSSMPDDELLALAAADRLNHPDVLRAQVDRLLRHPKSERFVTNFTGQWLGLRNIHFTEPDAKLYPEFDEMLRESIVKETHLFFREMLDRDLPLMDFVDSNWAILNERLARHYGIPGVTGQAFRRVSLPADSLRGGVLTQASVLKVTANGTTTSPVVRGVWVLENILGRPTPPPPSDVPAIEPDIRGAATIREQLARHRSIESCAVCHNQIDPPGMALESFDPIGGWRRWYRTLSAGAPVKLANSAIRVQYRLGRAVNSGGQMDDGRRFHDIRDLKNLLLEDKNQIARCLTEKLLTYSLGRGLGFSDRPAVKEIVAKVGSQNYGFRSLIHEVVQSRTFRQK